MTKAIRMMEDNLRLVDALIYVIDARAVYSCDNPLFNKLLQGKRVLYVFNKCDLVEKSDLDAWCELFKKQGNRTSKQSARAVIVRKSLRGSNKSCPTKSKNTPQKAQIYP